MPSYRVYFKHVEETDYTGFIEADTEEEAYAMVEENPFDIQGLEEENVQGLEVKDIELEEE